MNSILAIDWGGSAIKYGLYSNNKLTECSSINTPTSWSEMKSVIKDLSTKFEGVKGIAISAPGAVSTKDGVIYGCSAIDYIHNFKIRDELSNLVNLPVSIQNDANCSGLAELWQGHGVDCKDFFSIAVGSGIGGAYISDGRLREGKDCFGGEFGYMILDLVNNKSFSELASPVVYAQKYSADTGIKVNGKELFDLVDTDKLAKSLVDEFYNNLAIGIFNLVVSFNPEKVLIGGAISQRSDLASTLQERVNNLIKRSGAAGLEVEIQSCKFRNESNLLGAVYQFKLENNLAIS